MSHQPKLGSEYSTGYIKTLIKMNELVKDVEKMEFLSNVLIEPGMRFYVVRPTADKMPANANKNNTKPVSKKDKKD